jgi:chemotaxis protein methyltransferase CheR
MPATTAPLASILPGTRLLAGNPSITDRDFHAIRTMLYREAGISLSDGKRALVSCRLAKRLRHLKLRGYAEYLDYLATQDPQGSERQVMINCLTTNKTDFFREPHHFAFLRTSVFPLVERQAQQGGPRRLRIWSAGCSIGHEPYSIAMTILDHFSSLRGWDIRILASDINTQVLETAQRGIFPEEQLAPVDAVTRRNYFLRGTASQTGFCQVRPEVRRLVHFRQINLMEEPWPLQTRFDIIFCRNVIIYFDAATQQRLTLRFGDQLTDSGYLILGHSEHPHWLEAQFASCGGTIYQRKSARTRGAAKFPPPPAAAPPTPAAPKESPPLATHSIVVGEYFAAAAPTEISTGLGSCVAACLFDPETRIGGMNHFMLPGPDCDSQASARYGVHAMELLINSIMKLGGDRRRLQAKIFGGSNVLCFRNPVYDVAGNNCRFIRQFLETEKIPVAAQCLGGNQPLRVLFHPHSGRAFVKAYPHVCRGSNADGRCKNCAIKPPVPLPQGDVTLF